RLRKGDPIMWLSAICNSFPARAPQAKSGKKRSKTRRPRPPTNRLRLEPLEERALLSFAPAVSYPVGTSPVNLQIGDFNGDSVLDLAVPNLNSSSISVLLGNGDGTFQVARDTATNLAPGSLAVGDFNNDGRLDALVTRDNTTLTTDGSVLLGNGDG